MAHLILLTVINWLHLFATVAWIGGMTTNLLVLLPSIREALEPAVMGKLMGGVMKRFRIVTYISIVVLIVTGAVMTTFNASYMGLALFGNLWSIVALISKLAVKGPSPDLAHLQKKQIMLASTGFILGVIVLLLTGVMTAISATS
jgi:uncharacterized membrane protein